MMTVLVFFREKERIEPMSTVLEPFIIMDGLTNKLRASIPAHKNTSRIYVSQHKKRFQRILVLSWLLGDFVCLGKMVYSSYLYTANSYCTKKGHLV